MIQVILNNLLYIGIAFGIFALCVVANIVASVFYNVSKLKEKFDWKRLSVGVVKMLSVGLTTAILAVIVTLLPYLIQLTGVIVPDEANAVYTIGSIILLYFNAIKKYFLQAYETVKDILENKDIISND